MQLSGRERLNKPLPASKDLWLNAELHQQVARFDRIAHSDE
jgi:hypothetical protein